MTREYLGSVSDEEWAICEDHFDRERMRFREAILTLGNGYLGSRGILEEGYEEGYAGTYLAGVYDKSGGQSFAIVNGPNPVAMEIHVDGKKLCADEMEVVEHHRILDMKRAALVRRTLFADAGKRYEYQSRRFFSLQDMHTAVVSVSVRCLDDDASVVVAHTIDGTPRNEMHAVGGPRKHYQVTQAQDLGHGLSYLEAKTNDLGTVIGIATIADVSGAGPDFQVETGCRLEEESITTEYSFGVKKRARYELNIYISTYTSRETEGEIRAACVDGLRNAGKRGASRLLTDHTAAWEKRWQSADINIEGDESLQKVLRFSTYHLLIAAPTEDIDVSIPPKSLSGEWYQGHIFWDTEIFMFPFFVYAHPQLARHLLMYRARRLPQARECAVAQGYSGALWPWESADSGKEETPETWVNFDGTVLPVYNAKREHHIASDIVYAISLYEQHTGDKDFMFQHGGEMVFETARFWASRVVHDDASDSYEIKEVIGPNEFQECVDNNSYTNAMTRWTLRYACELYDDLRKQHPRELRVIAERIGLIDEEIDAWRKIAERIVFLMSSDGLIEEFEGYFGREDVTMTEWDEHGMPVWPSEVLLADVKETQLIKQADVVLLLYLLSEEFSLDEKRSNLEYYEPRTTHMSSLSITSYAILANELGDREKAYRYLHHAASADLEDIHGNTELGVHAAALGGAWQIVVRGFAGVRVKDDVLTVTPALPELWRSMRFQTWFRGCLVELAISDGQTEASMVKGRKALELEIYGERQVLRPGETLRSVR